MPTPRRKSKHRAASLTHYREKRDFSLTPEPKGAKGRKAGFRYLIQKHAAKRLHYDFRLELDGVLKSWAVTRGPSLDPQDKRLAVEVEDHPLEYGSFEGIIPKGQYGGGTVMLWDEGTWEPIGDPRAGLEKGKLEFILHGARLKGEWTLVRMRNRDEKRNNWLLIKHTDQEAQAGDEDQLLAENDNSVVTGRSMEEIAASEDAVWQSKVSGGDMTEFIPPQLATLADAAPRGKDWVYEVKFDGYRALASIAGGKVRIFTRSGQDWTSKFHAIARTLSRLPVRDAILDGEIVAIENGVSSFKALQNALSVGRDGDLQYYVFDLLHLNGKDLTQLPLIERKRQLESLFKAKLPNIFFSEHFSGDGEKLLKRLCKLRMEGLIAKRADAPYSSGRGKAWLKRKCHRRQEFIIGGFTQPTHAGRGIGALLIGYYDKTKFIYAGKVGTGFDNNTSLSLRKKLDKITQTKSAFASVPSDGRRGATWVKPKFVCEVEFTEWTGDGRLRHPSFQGLREDKPPVEIARETPVNSLPSPNQRGSKASLAGITITHPDRIIYPGTNITKEHLAEYYLTVAENILPHVANRPLSMIRCPEGIGGECFFQRHIVHGQSEHIYDTGVKVKGRDETYLMIKDVKGLLALVQFGVIELHPWGCHADNPDMPDRMIFDLDPASNVPWISVIEAAKEVRQRMQEFGLESFVKTTGGKGLHVTVPMAPAYGWKTVKAFARAIAESMAHDNPKRYISKASKDAREGKIFVDYLRNDLTSTAVTPYSARARQGATVAMPVAWENLKASLDPKSFTVETAPDLLQKRKLDPWKEFFKVRQKIAARHLQALAIEAA